MESNNSNDPIAVVDSSMQLIRDILMNRQDDADLPLLNEVVPQKTYTTLLPMLRKQLSVPQVRNLVDSYIRAFNKQAKNYFAELLKPKSESNEIPTASETVVAESPVIVREYAETIRILTKIIQTCMIHSYWLQKFFYEFSDFSFVAWCGLTIEQYAYFDSFDRFINPLIQPTHEQKIQPNKDQSTFSNQKSVSMNIFMEAILNEVDSVKSFFETYDAQVKEQADNLARVIEIYLTPILIQQMSIERNSSGSSNSSWQMRVIFNRELTFEKAQSISKNFSSEFYRRDADFSKLSASLTNQGLNQHEFLNFNIRSSIGPQFSTLYDFDDDDTENDADATKNSNEGKENQNAMGIYQSRRKLEKQRQKVKLSIVQQLIPPKNRKPTELEIERRASLKAAAISNILKSPIQEPALFYLESAYVERVKHAADSFASNLFTINNESSSSSSEEMNTASSVMDSIDTFVFKSLQVTNFFFPLSTSRVASILHQKCVVGSYQNLVMHPNFGLSSLLWKESQFKNGIQSQSQTIGRGEECEAIEEEEDHLKAVAVVDSIEEEQINKDISTCKRMFEFGENDPDSKETFIRAFSQLIFENLKQIEETHLKKAKQRYFGNFSDAVTDWISNLLIFTDRLRNRVLHNFFNSDPVVRKAIFDGIQLAISVSKVSVDYLVKFAEITLQLKEEITPEIENGNNTVAAIEEEIPESNQQRMQLTNNNDNNNKNNDSNKSVTEATENLKFFISRLQEKDVFLTLYLCALTQRLIRKTASSSRYKKHEKTIEKSINDELSLITEFESILGVSPQTKHMKVIVNDLLKNYILFKDYSDIFEQTNPIINEENEEELAGEEGEKYLEPSDQDCSLLEELQEAIKKQNIQLSMMNVFKSKSNEFNHINKDLRDQSEIDEENRMKLEKQKSNLDKKLAFLSQEQQEEEEDESRNIFKREQNRSSKDRERSRSSRNRNPEKYSNHTGSKDDFSELEAAAEEEEDEEFSEGDSKKKNQNEKNSSYYFGGSRRKTGSEQQSSRFMTQPDPISQEEKAKRLLFLKDSRLNLSHCISITVFSGPQWPLEVNKNLRNSLIIPQALATYFSKYQQRYLTDFQNRALNLLPECCSGILVFNKRITLELSFVSMLILIAFNGKVKEPMSVKAIQVATGIPAGLLKVKLGELTQANVLATAPATSKGEEFRVHAKLLESSNSLAAKTIRVDYFEKKRIFNYKLLNKLFDDTTPQNQKGSNQENDQLKKSKMSSNVNGLDAANEKEGASIENNNKNNETEEDEEIGTLNDRELRQLKEYQRSMMCAQIMRVMKAEKELQELALRSKFYKIRPSHMKLPSSTEFNTAIEWCVEHSFLSLNLETKTITYLN